MKIVFISTNGEGGRRVRSLWPAAALRSRGWDVVVHSTAGQWPLVEPGDVIIIHRPIDPEVAEAVRYYRSQGVWVVVQDDDDNNTVPAQNAWRPTLQQIARHDEAVSLADGLIVTTEGLRDVYGPLAQRTWVIRNYLPRDLCGQPERKTGGTPVVGWAGTLKVHLQDIRWIAPVADRMLAGARFFTVGDVRVLRELGLGDPHDGKPWTPEQADFYSAMGRCDIGIVPLDMGENLAFNRSKSWLKALEFMSLGKPVVVCDLPEQRRLVRHGIEGFVAKDPGDFANAVQMLVHDRALRSRMAAAASARAQLFTIERRVGEWERMLGELTREEAA